MRRRKVVAWALVGGGVVSLYRTRERAKQSKVPDDEVVKLVEADPDEARVVRSDARLIDQALKDLYVGKEVNWRSPALMLALARLEKKRGKR